MQRRSWTGRCLAGCGDAASHQRIPTSDATSQGSASGADHWVARSGGRPTVPRGGRAQEGGASAADMLLSIASHPRRYPAVYPGIAAEHTLSAETKAFLRRAESVLKVIKPEEPLTWVRMHFSQPKATSILACF